MKDSLQRYLISHCHVQSWARKQIAKDKEFVEKIKIGTIKSVKQKIK
jgi:hypothetical protein